MWLPRHPRKIASVLPNIRQYGIGDQEKRRILRVRIVVFELLDTPGETMQVSTRTIVRLAAGALGVSAAGYAVYVATAWARYNHAAPPDHEAADPLLDRFMPTYEIAERHHIAVAAPAEITFNAAREMDLNQSMIVRGVFRARELVLGAEPDAAEQPQGIVALMTSIGWGVLAEVPGRELVMGAVTQPWKANVVFRALPPDQFAAFNDAADVKIVWTLRADPVDAAHSIFRTETRALTTDAAARRNVRRYWSFLSPGIIVIRWMSLGPLKVDAERRAKGALTFRSSGMAQGAQGWDMPSASTTGRPHG